MRCDELRQSVTDGAPFDDEARGHLAACPSCGGEFPELRALTSPPAPPPAALRERVLAAFPVRRAFPWGGLARAAAILILGLGVGFVSGFAVNKTKLVEVPGPVVQVDRPVDKPVPDDYVSNVGIAADSIYGEQRMGAKHLVEVKFAPNSIRIQRITVDPHMRDIEKYCPIARQLGALAAKRPDVVVYKDF